LPDEYDYSNDLETIVFNCGDYDLWYEKFNADYKYSIKSSQTIKNVRYITLICYHTRHADCKFTANINIKNEKVTLKISDHHNHEFNDERCLLHNPIKICVKDELIDLLYSGETPTGALKILKEKSTNYISDSKDRSIIPNLTDVYYLFKKERRINFGSEFLSIESIETLKRNSEDYLKINYEYFEGNFVIAFCTKKMIGALYQNFLSSKIMFIDSSGGMDRSCGHLFSIELFVP